MGSSVAAARPGRRLEERSRASKLLERYSNHPSAFLALNEETEHFTSPNADGFAAFRRAGRYFFQIGSLFAPDEARLRLLEDFQAAARREGRRICAVQLREDDIPSYRRLGFRVNQLGASFTVDLSSFTMAGTRFMKLRNKIKQAHKLGVEVIELGVDAPWSAQLWGQLEQVTATWLRSKGRFKKLLQFMVGELGEPQDPLRRIFVALHRQQVAGFITYVPSYGRHAGLMHDLTRRRPDAPTGVMEAINAAAIERFRSEGCRFLNFGFTPFVGLRSEWDGFEGRSGALAWFLQVLAKHGSAIYPAQNQMDYKMKWNPQIITPEYFAFEGRLELRSIIALLILTRSI
jgi:lysylphosphatidylglycerol synthetase-like protein (DUF2156 family)